MQFFGDPTEWPEQDLVALTDDFDPLLILEAYRSGLFPMPVEEYDCIGWFSPLDRGVLPLDGLKVARSLRKTAKRYRLTINRAFADVMRGCADPRRDGGWIDEQIFANYNFLHQHGYAHSVEAWDAEGHLVGGLYGVGVGGLFAGESMFHDPLLGRDASKAALIGLVSFLNGGEVDAGPAGLGSTPDGAGRLLDVQWRTDHLASLGVIEIPREEYLDRLSDALELPAPAWPSPQQ